LRATQGRVTHDFCTEHLYTLLYLSYLRRIDFCALNSRRKGLVGPVSRVIKKKKKRYLEEEFVVESFLVEEDVALCQEERGPLLRVRIPCLSRTVKIRDRKELGQEISGTGNSRDRKDQGRSLSGRTRPLAPSPLPPPVEDRNIRDRKYLGQEISGTGKIRDRKYQGLFPRGKHINNEPASW
jgi:hypothetical protein